MSSADSDETTEQPDLHHISLNRSGGISVVVHATSDDAAHEIEQFVKEELPEKFYRVHRERDHNSHRDQEAGVFRDCYQVVVETIEDAASDIAGHVSEQFGPEVEG